MTPTADGPDPSGRGHIGLTVLGSVALGVGLGLVLDLLVLGGRHETLLTGAALLSFAGGCATLAVVSTRRTDQPQLWARVPAVVLGITGAAILIAGPSDHTLRVLGWVWPVVLLALVVWMVRASRRSLRNWSRRALLYPAFGVLALVAVGGAYETVAEATNSNTPSSGRTYVVAGHRLYLSCSGTGSPTVVLFNGLSERTPSWAWVQQDVARATRVCVFDRAGQGWSGKAPGRQDVHALSADVHGLLTAAHVPAPYVLAGHSVGGTYALGYALDNPQDVAGIALIDSATPYQFDLPAYPGFYAMWTRVSALLPSLARAGIARFVFGIGLDALPRDARSPARAFVSSAREYRADRIELAELRTVFDQVKALKSIGRKPLFVLTADRGQQSGWAAAQDRLARLSTNSRHQTTQGATHAALLYDARYAAVTSRAITNVVRAARSGGRLTR